MLFDAMPWVGTFIICSVERLKQALVLQDFMDPPSFDGFDYHVPEDLLNAAATAFSEAFLAAGPPRS